MLCAKCQKNEATLHVTTIPHGGKEETIPHGGKEETIQLCKDCDTEATRFATFDPSKVEALPIIARKCEFCGEDAFSAKTLAGDRTIYWCFDCEAEYRRTFTELFFGEHPEFMERVKTRSSFLPFVLSQQFQAWWAEAGQRVVQILKERRQGYDGNVAS